MIEFQLIDDSQTIDVNLTSNEETIDIGLIKEIDKYPDLKDLPSINNVTLTGNKTLHELGIQPEGDYVEKVEGKGLSTNDYTTSEKNKLASLENYDDTEVRQLINTKQPRGNYALKSEIPTKNSQLQNDSGFITQETDPTVPSHVKTITQNNITNWDNKQEQLISGTNIKTINNTSILGSGNIEIEGGGSSDYEELDNLPKVNNVTLKGNKSLSDLGIQPAGKYLTSETDPTVPSYVKSITQENITSWNNKQNAISDLSTIRSGASAGATAVQPSDLATVATSGSYNDLSNKPSEVTESTVSNWGFTKNTGTYSKPSGGIPKSDLTNDVQTSLGKADTALQNYIETDPTVPSHVKNITQANITSWNNKADSGDIPTALSDLSDDSTHRLVTDTEKATWNGKANVSDIPKVFYGTSATGASTAAKVVVCEEFTEADLVAGARITVLFTNANTYNGQATLNINGTGAKNIYYNGSTTNARYMWVAGESVDFIYNGTQWATINGGLATTSYYGVTKLATGANSDSQSYALTPRSLYYFANYSIAPYYSASKTYAVGDKVRYTYYIYECITAIETPEAWTAAHWQQIDTLQEQIDAINTTIGDIDTILTRLTTGSGV